MDITRAVQNLYERFPFPPLPVLSSPPPGWNWRWSWNFAHDFCLGYRPSNQAVRILDAGCGTGVGTEYLSYQNPEARITAVDLSAASLDIARKRCARRTNVEFAQISLLDVPQLGNVYDLINCVGVLHHLPNPDAGLRVLADSLAPGGLMHVFVYGELGRWEIHLMQQAIRLLQPGTLEDGLKVGRELFDVLPEHNRLVQAERERWALENRDDASFVDMYVHVQEVRYRIPTLFELIDRSGLTFLGFSNPEFWSLDRLLGKSPWLAERAAALGERECYRLIELLDPVVSHYEFFLGRPPLEKIAWTDERLSKAQVYRSPYIHPWPPMRQVFDHNYNVVELETTEIAFLEACDGRRTVSDLLSEYALANGFADVRRFHEHFLIQLTPVAD